MNAYRSVCSVCIGIAVVIANVHMPAAAQQEQKTLQSFGGQMNHGQPVRPLPANVALGLYNPDPLLDLAYYADGKVQVWQNLGDGTFGSEPVYEQRVSGEVKKMEWRKSRKLIGLFDDIQSWGDLHITFIDGRSETLRHTTLLNTQVDLSFIPTLLEGPPFRFREVWRSERNPFPQVTNLVGDFDNNGRLNIGTWFSLSPSPFDQRQRLVFPHRC